MNDFEEKQKEELYYCYIAEAIRETDLKLAIKQISLGNDLNKAQVIYNKDFLYRIIWKSSYYTSIQNEPLKQQTLYWIMHDLLAGGLDPNDHRNRLAAAKLNNQLALVERPASSSFADLINLAKLKYQFNLIKLLLLYDAKTDIELTISDQQRADYIEKPFYNNWGSLEYLAAYDYFWADYQQFLERQQQIKQLTAQQDYSGITELQQQNIEFYFTHQIPSLAFKEHDQLIATKQLQLKQIIAAPSQPMAEFDSLLDYRATLIAKAKRYDWWKTQQQAECWSDPIGQLTIYNQITDFDQDLVKYCVDQQGRINSVGYDVIQKIIDRSSFKLLQSTTAKSPTTDPDLTDFVTRIKYQMDLIFQEEQRRLDINHQAIDLKKQALKSFDQLVNLIDKINSQTANNQNESTKQISTIILSNLHQQKTILLSYFSQLITANPYIYDGNIVASYQQAAKLDISANYNMQLLPIANYSNYQQLSLAADVGINNQPALLRKRAQLSKEADVELTVIDEFDNFSSTKMQQRLPLLANQPDSIATEQQQLSTFESQQAQQAQQLFLAVENNHYFKVADLLLQAAPLNYYNSNQDNILHFAVNNAIKLKPKALEILELLFKAGAKSLLMSPNNSSFISNQINKHLTATQDPFEAQAILNNLSKTTPFDLIDNITNTQLKEQIMALVTEQFLSVDLLDHHKSVASILADFSSTDLFINEDSPATPVFMQSSINQNKVDEIPVSQPANCQKQPIVGKFSKNIVTQQNSPKERSL